MQRNRDAILDVLRRVLPPSGLVLEVASGSGEHARYFAESLPGLMFQPSDPGDAQRVSIDAWSAGVANIRPALALDASSEWQLAAADAVLCINMIHISPWAATVGLMRNAGRVVTKSMILSHIWDYAFEPQTNVVDVLVCRTRNKVDKGFDKQRIKTLRGLGYLLDSE